MFSGIVESVQPVVFAEASPGLVRIRVTRPVEFTDLKIGDSIAVDGVCLTLENFDSDLMQFALAAETLKILGWPEADQLMGKKLNLERSLKYGDRIHGHLVSGHVECLGKIQGRELLGESLFLKVSIPSLLAKYVWKKGSLAINGVSLTLNEVSSDQVEVCLIPETQKRTNLSLLKVGDSVTLEPDWMAKAMSQNFQKDLS